MLKTPAKLLTESQKRFELCLPWRRVSADTASRDRSFTSYTLGKELLKRKLNVVCKKPSLILNYDQYKAGVDNLNRVFHFILYFCCFVHSASSYKMSLLSVVCCSPSALTVVSSRRDEWSLPLWCGQKWTQTGTKWNSPREGPFWKNCVLSYQNISVFKKKNCHYK